jgi:hypothetical protein
VRSNENILLNDDFSVTDWPSGPRVEVGDDRRPEADDAVISDFDIRGMDFVNINKLANPDIGSHLDSANPL